MSKLEFEQEKEHENTVQYGGRLELEDPEEPKAPDLKDIADESDGDEQLALFDEPSEKESKSKKKAAPAKKSEPKKAAPEEKVGSEYTVFYAGHKIPVPKDDMTLEELRSFLESDFPELSKERAEMLLDKEQKHVVPVVKGAKKG